MTRIRKTSLANPIGSLTVNTRGETDVCHAAARRITAASPQENQLLQRNRRSQGFSLSPPARRALPRMTTTRRGAQNRPSSLVASLTNSARDFRPAAAVRLAIAASFGTVEYALQPARLEVRIQHDAVARVPGLQSFKRGVDVAHRIVLGRGEHVMPGSEVEHDFEVNRRTGGGPRDAVLP